MTARILVVDDDVDLRRLLTRQLERRGFETVAVGSAEEASDALANAGIDAVLTDVSMRGMGGIEFCKRVAAMGTGIPVLMLTAYGSMETAVEALRAGASDFITKPVDVEVLVFGLERALERRRLHEEVRRLREAVPVHARNRDLIGESDVMRRAFDTLQRVAGTDVSVLVTGASGTGKEVAARFVHEQSARRSGPFVAVNCSALPDALLESELFGHRRGAFTGAATDREGLVVGAHGGTLFLDEIGELPRELQPKLLRALQERRVRPVGSDAEVDVDVRLVTATNRDLDQLVAEGAFREDLFYRINVVSVRLPALAARGNDTLLLAQHFVGIHAARMNKRVRGLSPPVAAALLAYAWPGNVRELGNCIERAVALTEHEELTLADLPPRVLGDEPASVLPTAESTEELPPLAEVERRYVLRVFDACGGSASRTAQVLGVDRKTLYRRLEQYRKTNGGRAGAD